MTDIFISYKREDEARVASIVEGLRGAGLSVWWDRDISAGDSWRQAISEHLESARCVIVVWSETSVDPGGELVHDVAGRAKARGVLLPVRIDRITAPLGFGEVQSLDLVGWRGNRRNLRFRNLVAAAQAVVAGRQRPRPTTPGLRARLLAGWVSAFGVAATVLGFASDLAGLQGHLCKIPGIHGVCASRGFGGLPTQEEENLWSRRLAGDCEGLRAYLSRFPQGAYAEEAGRRLQAAETVEKESWVQEERSLPLTVRTTLAPLVNEEAARADALARGATEARTTCESFNSREFRLVSAAAEVQSWRCSARGSGSVCGFDGKAVCRVEARQVVQRQVCREPGPGRPG
jgi:hypothetical protein